VFETMIFGGPFDQYQDRYCTWAEAVAGHKRAVDLVSSWRILMLKRLDNVLYWLRCQWYDWKRFLASRFPRRRTLKDRRKKC
jgi:hypothetical protein